MADTNTNQIEVTLHLMSNDEIDRLREIATMLSTALGGASSVSSSSPGQQRAATGTSPPTTGGVPGSYVNSPGQHLALPHHLAWMTTLPGGGALESAIGGLNRRVPRDGSPLDLMASDQPMGQYAHPFLRGGIAGLNYATMLGAGVPFIANAAMRPFNAAVNLASNIAGSPSATFGAGLGLSSQGILGTPFFSPAFNYGIQQNLLNPLAATFTSNPFSTPGSFLNPMFGAGSYMEMQQALQQFGWNANTPFGGQMQSALLGLGKQMGTSGVNALGGPSALAEFLDPARYGGNSIQGLTAQLKLLGDAAMATNMNVGQLRSGLVQAAQTIASETGAPGQAVNQQLLGLSFATGFGPSVTQGLLGSQTLQNLAIAQSGGNIYQALYGPKAGQGVLGGLQMIIGQLTGTGSWAGLQAALKDPNRRNGILNRLAWVYRTNPQLLGGLRPDQIVQLADKGNLAGGYQFGVDLSTAQTALDQGRFSSHMMNLLLQDASAAGLSASQIASIKHGSHGYQDEVTKLAKAVSQMTGNSITKAGQQGYVQVDLTDRAARYLQKIIPNTSSAHSNSSPPPVLSAAYPSAFPAPRR